MRTLFARLNMAGGRLPQVRAGSRVEVTGVYAANAGKSSGRTLGGPFELFLNSPADLRVLQLPSWWTSEHAVIVVSVMAIVILLAVAWISMLRQQVGRRTAELSTANLALKEEIAERRRAEDELVRTRLQHLVEQERTRIARDLHDDLGSRVTRIVLLNELAVQNRVPPGETVEHAREISAAARQVIQSLDETVWAVNPRNDTLPHLINYLGQFAVEFLRAASVRCRLDLPDHPPARTVSAETRHNLFLAMKEALNNAVRHAQASEVRLGVVCDEGSLVLTVQDNGHGFAPGQEQLSAEGLRNMQQRMEEIGGRFNLESAADRGTKVTLMYLWPKEG